MFDVPAPSSTVIAYQECSKMMEDANHSMSQILSEFKNQWIYFWDPGVTVEVMQARLDFLATTVVTDQGQQTNALSAYFAKALRFITFLSTEVPGAFDDAVQDINETDMPGTSSPFQRFLTPGWYYTVEETGRLVVSEPVEWMS